MMEAFEIQEQQTYRQEAKRAFSRAGFALSLMFLISQLLQVALELVMSSVWPTYAEDVPILYWVVMFAPIYCAGMPAGLAILRKIPTDRDICEQPAEGESMSLARWIRLLPIAFFLMYSGSMIGTLFTAILTSVLPSFNTGGEDINALLELLSGPGLIPRILVVCIAGPFMEEYVFRKQLIDRTRIYGEELSVLFSSVMFGLFHGNLKQGLYATLLGLLLGYVYLRTRKILYSFGIHACVNFMGGVIAPAVVSGVDADLMDGAAGVIAFGFAVIVLFVLGCVLFITQWKKVRLLPAERELQRKEKDASWQNGGVILFCVLGSISILLTLMMGIGF